MGHECEEEVLGMRVMWVLQFWHLCGGIPASWKTLKVNTYSHDRAGTMINDCSFRRLRRLEGTHVEEAVPPCEDIFLTAPSDPLIASLIRLRSTKMTCDFLCWVMNS